CAADRQALVDFTACFYGEPLARRLVPLAGDNRVLARRQIEGVIERGSAYRFAIDQNLRVAGIHRERHDSDARLGGLETLLSGQALFLGRLGMLPQVLSEVRCRGGLVPGADLALRQVEQNGWVRLERIGLHECKARPLVFFVVEEVHAFVEPLPSSLYGCIAPLGARLARNQRERQKREEYKKQCQT